MGSIPKTVGLLLLILCHAMNRSNAQRNSQRKDELIQDTVRKFLGVKLEERATSPGQALPPQYMMDLYEKYRSGHTPMQGNTVRSILAMRDIIDNVNMLIFNLTGLKSTEQILQSKLYLLKRRKPKNGRKRHHSSFRLNIGCLPNMTIVHHIDISLVRQKREWHSYDISESVVSCRQTKKGKESLLGLTLEVKRPKGNYRLMSFKRLIKQNSQPFVLIFSEDSQNQTNIPSYANHDGYDEIKHLLKNRANQEGIPPGTPTIRGHNHHRHEKRSLDSKTSNLNYFNHSRMFFTGNYLQKYNNEEFDSYSSNISIQNIFVKMLRNVVNKLRHDLSFDDHFELKNLEASKAISHSKQQSQNVHNRNQSETTHTSKRFARSIASTVRYETERKKSNNSETTMKTIQVIDKDILDEENSNIFIKSHRRNRKRKMHKIPKRHKKKRRRNRKIPFWWTRHDKRLHTQDLKQMCRRKSLQVDFTQLGWDEWIISPKSFNAHYCEGSCTFPIIKHTETSNHAAIQSLIHALGINADIPTPCCVPSVTSSLTLLYFDERGSLVLKSYPNMIVEKCGCR